MSEGGEAASGKYWFHSIVPERTVLAPCDMKTEGEFKCLSIHIFYRKIKRFTTKLPQYSQGEIKKRKAKQNKIMKSKISEGNKDMKELV